MNTVTDNFNIKQWFLISLALRIIVMPFTVHADIYHVYNVPHFLSHGEWNAYEIAAQKFLNYYPPLALIFFAVVEFLFRIISPGFEQFTHSLAFIKGNDLYGSEHLFLSLFFMKLPYLIFDCFLILTCWKMLPNDKSKFAFTVFWAVNPVVIYSTYMFGQFELIAEFFVVLACYFSLQRGREHFACLSLAAGCLFKVIPIIFLPVVVLISSRNIKDFIRLSLYGIVPIMFFYGIFYLVSGDAVFKLFTDLTEFTKFSTEIKILVLRFCQVVIYILICFHILFLLQKKQLNYTLLIQYFLAISLANHWSMEISPTHYYIWLIPFLILFIQEHPYWKKPFYLFLLLIFLAGLKPRTGTLGIFAPINPELFLSFPSLKDVTGFLFDQKTYETIMDISIIGMTGLLAVAILKNLYSPYFQRYRTSEDS